MVKRWLRVQYSSLIGWNLSPWMRTSWPSTGKPLPRKIHQSPKLKTMYRHKTQYRKLGFMMGSESFVDTNNISCGFFTSYFCFCFLKFKIYANARTPPKNSGVSLNFCLRNLALQNINKAQAHHLWVCPFQKLQYTFNVNKNMLVPCFSFLSKSRNIN